jgi:hypothetical protein
MWTAALCLQGDNVNAKNVRRQRGVERVLARKKAERLEIETLKNKSGIYAIVNTVNNHRYIGQTKDLLQRKRDHFNNLKGNKHHSCYLQNSYNIHGANKFQFVVLEYVYEWADLNEREQFWITELKPEYNSILDINEGIRGYAKRDIELPMYRKDGESFYRPAWHAWVYGGEREPKR